MLGKKKSPFLSSQLVICQTQEGMGKCQTPGRILEEKETHPVSWVFWENRKRSVEQKLGRFSTEASEKEYVAFSAILTPLT